MTAKKTTKADRDALDALVLGLFRFGYSKTLANLMHDVPLPHGERDVDRSLQRLRKAKHIRFKHGAWHMLRKP